MGLRRFLIILILVSFLTTPLFAANKTELIPAPEVELGAGELPNVMEIIADLERKILKERPSDARTVYGWFTSAGNAIGIGGDVITASYAAAGHEMSETLSDSLEKFGLAFAITTCLEKQFVSGEPAGLDAAYETAKFLTGKITGGGAAAVGILKFALDTFGNAAMAQIDSDFYRTYCNWQLQERKDWNYYFDLYAKPNGAAEVTRVLDGFWKSTDVSINRGFGLLMTKYKGDEDNVKAAYRQKFSKEYLFPAMRNLWEDKRAEAEAELILQANKLYVSNKAKKKIRIVVKDIVDRGTAKGARDLKATLIHGGKYIVAETAINGGGASFEFPAGKLIDPESKKPAGRVKVKLEPANNAQFVDGRFTEISIELAGKHPRIRKQVVDGVIDFQMTKPVYVHMAYPVTVKIDSGTKITSIQTRIIAGKSQYYHSGSLGGRSVSKGNGVFFFEKMPTGKCTFTYATRRATKMITGAQTITLDPPVPVKLDGGVAVPRKPDLAAVNAQRIQALEQRKNLDKFEDDVKDAIGAVTAKMAELKEDYLERYNIAFETLRQQDYLLRQQKGMDSKQREALRKQMGAKRQSLQAAQKATMEELTELRKRYNEAEKKVSLEIRDEDSKIQAEYNQARKELYAETGKVRDLEKQIQKAVRDVSSELNHNSSVYKSLTEAETAIEQLEQEVAKIDDLVQQIQTSVDAANAARLRFEAQLDAQEKRRFAREHPASKIPPVLADVQQAKLLLDSLKKNAVAEKTKRAARAVKKKHELRKKNAAEFANLLEEIKTLGAKLPDVDPKAFDHTYQQASAGFAEILDDPKAKAKTLAKVYSKVEKFLDRNDEVIGDLRSGGKEKELPYARIETLSRKLTDMMASGLVYAGTDYYKAWEPAQAKLMTAATVRTGSGRRLIALEKDLLTAKEDLDGYRSRVGAAVVDTEALIDQAREITNSKSVDFGTVLDNLDKAWKTIDQMPVFRRAAYQEKIMAVADAFADNGALVNYAKASKRPLVVFDSYLEGGDANKETKINRPIFRCKPSPGAYTSVILKARVIGLPPGKGALIAVEDDWNRYTCHREKKSGLYFVNLTLMGDHISQIRVLGTGEDNPPIEYPFFKQVAVN